MSFNALAQPDRNDADLSADEPTGSGAPRELGAPTLEVVSWHGAWALAIAFAAFGLIGARVLTDGVTAAALLCALLPGLAGFLLLRRDGLSERTILLGLWALGGALAATFSGGVSGPLAVWTLLPIAAAAGFGRADMMARAATFSLLAGLIAAASTLGGWAGPEPVIELRPWLAAVALITTTAGLGASLVLARRRTREALRHKEQGLAALDGVLAGQPDLLLVLDPAGQLQGAYGQAPPGVSMSLLRQGGLGVLFPPSDRHRILGLMREVLQTGHLAMAFTPEGAPGVHLSLALKSRGDGRTIIGILRDATDERTALDAAEAARAEAESLAAGRASFLANMSHELRTPLNAIMGFSDIMKNRMFGELPAKYGEYAELIHDSGTHLLDLINDVLDMSKIEARKFELNREVLDPREPVAAALRILRLQADDAGVALHASLPSQAAEADLDRRALKQIVLNLVSNALKFTPRGGTVTVALATQGEQLDLTVSDTGAGIAEADLARLGRPYEQAGEDSDKARGTGLGLSLVRSFAELHGGEMIIESTLGEGTSVTVRMPVVLPPSEQPKPVGDNVVVLNPKR